MFYYYSTFVRTTEKKIHEKFEIIRKRFKEGDTYVLIFRPHRSLGKLIKTNRKILNSQNSKFQKSTFVRTIENKIRKNKNNSTPIEGGNTF